MKPKTLLALLAAIGIFSFPGVADAAEISASDQEKIISNFRKSASVMPNWQIQIKDIKDSPFPSLIQATMEFRSGTEVRMQNVFISTDSKQYIVGNLFKSDEDQDVIRRGKLTVEGSPSRGRPNSPITIWEFSDLGCSSCKFAHEQITADKTLEAYPGKIRWVYKNRPIARSHVWALDAAVACMCAYKLNHAAFWKMQDDIFTQQSSITVNNLWEKLSGFAKASHLDPAKFKACCDQKETLPEVKRDLDLAESLGVVQTPTFFVDGRIVVGYPGGTSFKLLIDEFLKKPNR